MNGKERLEEIKEHVKKIESIIYGEWRQPPELADFFIESLYYDDHVDWLINRVEELEMKISINTNNMKKLQKENERYKQALEEIRGLYPLRNVGYQVSEIRKIVIKALEGEK